MGQNLHLDALVPSLRSQSGRMGSSLALLFSDWTWTFWRTSNAYVTGQGSSLRTESETMIMSMGGTFVKSTFFCVPQRTVALQFSDHLRVKDDTLPIANHCYCNTLSQKIMECVVLVVGHV